MISNSIQCKENVIKMPIGRPKKNKSQRGIKKYIIVYTEQSNDLKKFKDNIPNGFTTNDSEIIRAAISILDQFESDFVIERIIDQRARLASSS
tara:strand:+ start:102 stop:380 length:279 start_codon:yes stop_codon:yes gene_type:complete